MLLFSSLFMMSQSPYTTRRLIKADHIYLRIQFLLNDLYVEWPKCLRKRQKERCPWRHEYHCLKCLTDSRSFKCSKIFVYLFFYATLPSRIQIKLRMKEIFRDEPWCWWTPVGKMDKPCDERMNSAKFSSGRLFVY